MIVSEVVPEIKQGFLVKMSVTFFSEIPLNMDTMACPFNDRINLVPL